MVPGPAMEPQQWTYSDKGRIQLRLASGAGPTFGVDDIAVAWAHSNKFIEAEGVDVEWVPVRGGVKAIEAVLAGEVHGAYGTWAPAVSRILEGAPLKILMSTALNLAQNLVVNHDRVSSTEELRGKRWAVDGIGALSHTLAQLIIRGLGIPDDEVEWVVAGPPPERIEKLLNREVDCSLVRVEEALALKRQHPEQLRLLLNSDSEGAGARANRIACSWPFRWVLRQPTWQHVLYRSATSGALGLWASPGETHQRLHGAQAFQLEPLGFNLRRSCGISGAARV